MYLFHLQEADDAFFARANVCFYLDDDPANEWDECPVRIVTWKDVFSAFVFDARGPNGGVQRGIMAIFIHVKDDFTRIKVDIDELAVRTSIRDKKQIRYALSALEKTHWIARVDNEHVCLEPRLVERAKRLYRKLAWSVGYDVEVDTELSQKEAHFRDSVMMRQTSFASAEPRRTIGARTFFVRLDKTS